MWQGGGEADDRLWKALSSILPPFLGCKSSLPPWPWESSFLPPSLLTQWCEEGNPLRERSTKDDSMACLTWYPAEGNFVGVEMRKNEYGRKERKDLPSV